MRVVGRHLVVGAVAGVALLAGGWAVHAAPGMPVPAQAPAHSGDAGVAQAEAAVTAAEQQVLDQANAQGASEIAALKTAQTRLGQAQTALAQATQAEAAYRQAALQATARAQQLAAQLQVQSRSLPVRRGDDGGGDD